MYIGRTNWEPMIDVAQMSKKISGRALTTTMVEVVENHETSRLPVELGEIVNESYARDVGCLMCDDRPSVSDCVLCRDQFPRLRSSLLEHQARLPHSRWASFLPPALSPSFVSTSTCSHTSHTLLSSPRPTSSRHAPNT